MPEASVQHDPPVAPKVRRPISARRWRDGQMGWVPPSPDGIAMCQDDGLIATKRRGWRDDGDDDRGGSGKARFPAPRCHTASTTTGHVMPRKTLTRAKVRRFMADHPACTVVVEACGRASHRAREMARLGHDARPIAPHYVRPFVTRQKTESADAEAIVIAARQPEMRVKEPKTVEEQSRAAVFRGRERRVHQRTADVNALRALLHAPGHVFPIGDTPARSHHGARGGRDLRRARADCRESGAHHRAHHETQDAGRSVGQGAAAPDHAGNWGRVSGR